MELRSSPCGTSKEASSVSSKRTQRSPEGVQLKAYPSSIKAKKPRLQQFVFRTCLVCTVEVQALQLPNPDSVDQQIEALDQLSTLLDLGSWRLNIRNPINCTVCATCQGRLDQLTSVIDNIKILETEVNLLTEALYSDLKKSFHSVDDASYCEAIRYRNYLVENQKTYVFEAKPLKNNFIEPVSSWHEDQNLNHSEDNGTPVQGFGDELIEETELDFDEIELKVEDAKGDGSQESVIEDTGPQDDIIETSIHKKLQVFSCEYVKSGDGSKCQMSFGSEEALEIHTNAHTLHISLGRSKIIVEQHGIKIFKGMLKQKNIVESDQSIACPACGRASFRGFSGLIHHMSTVHLFQTYPCRYYTNQQIKCSDLFASEEEVQEHVKSCHEGLGSKTVEGRSLERRNQDHDLADYLQPVENEDMMCVICGTSNCCHEVRKSAAIQESLQNPDHDVAAYPQRVENDEMMCVVCGPKAKICRTKTAHIKHMLSSHSYFVCNYKDPNGTNCLGGFKSNVAVQNHLKIEHQLEASQFEDLGLLYLDPRCQSSQCPNCGTKGLHRQTYVNHLRKHGLFVCGAESRNATKSLCTRTFDREIDLNLHTNVCVFRKEKSRKQSILKSFRKTRPWCRICKFQLKFSSRAAWLDHVKKHDAFACNIYMPDKKRYCNTLYMVRPLLKSHIDTDHPNVSAEEAAGPVDNGGSTGIDVLNEEPPEILRGLPVEGSFACANCDATFEVYDQTWVDHVRSHGAFICDAMNKDTGKPCLALFYRLETLIIHCKKQHERILEGVLHCEVCDTGCESLEIYNRHQRMHGSKRGLICDARVKRNNETCHKVDEVPTPKEVRSTDAPDDFPCLPCKKVFDSVALLSLHFQEHHDKAEELNFNCNICSTTLKTSDALRKNGEETFYSTNDSVEHADFTSLCAQHWKTCTTKQDGTSCSEIEDPLFECYVCRKNQNSPQSLAVHLNEHHGVSETHRCLACSSIFGMKTLLNNHLKSCHNLKSYESEQYYCERCWEPFLPTDPEMKLGAVAEQDMVRFLTFADQHFQCKASKVKPKCRHCSLEFSSMQNLFLHDVRFHSRKHFKHYCERCGKGFADAHNLNQHFELHEIQDGKREKPTCEICGKTFSYSRALKLHLRCHDIQPPFVCQYCAKGFITKYSLVQHEKNHTARANSKEATVPCPICGKLFVTQRYMNYHVTWTHEKRLKRKKPERNSTKERPEDQVDAVRPHRCRCSRE